MKTDHCQRLMTDSGAIAELWTDPLDVEMLFRQFSRLPHCAFLDSARPHASLARYSFLAADPFDYFEVSADGSDGLSELARRLQPFQAETFVGLPPFQGGAIGLFSYDLSRSLEAIPAHHADEFQLPALAVGLYDLVLAIDHVEDQAWLISQGFPCTDPQSRHERAAQRLAQLKRGHSTFSDHPRPRSHNQTQPLPHESLAAHFAVLEHPGLYSNFAPDEYRRSVQKAIDYIHAGDAFQINLAQRLIYRAHDDAVSLYLRLRNRNPAPMAAYFDLGHSQIVSASPERFLSVNDGLVEARPIKGTRPRLDDPAADAGAIDELLHNEKDRAENVMIVDLLRNDLSRVCQPASVRVTQCCQLESFERVHHLVSAIEGRLAEGRSPVDLLRAAFPGGSITGAPKVRACEIIAELEPTARGPYCGALGYFGFNGAMDTSILIRTITASRGWWQFGVGGGIVAQSTPQREYEETWHKAAGMIESLA